MQVTWTATPRRSIVSMRASARCNGPPLEPMYSCTAPSPVASRAINSAQTLLTLLSSSAPHNLTTRRSRSCASTKPGGSRKRRRARGAWGDCGWGRPGCWGPGDQGTGPSFLQRHQREPPVQALADGGRVPLQRRQPQIRLTRFQAGHGRLRRAHAGGHFGLRKTELHSLGREGWPPVSGVVAPSP